MFSRNVGADQVRDLTFGNSLLKVFACIAVVLVTLFFGSQVSAQSTVTELQRANEPQERLSDQPGILPALTFLLQLPEPARFTKPGQPAAPNEPVVYDRTFPIGGQAAVDRGYLLPPPIGVSLIHVHNVGIQDITDIDIALGVDVTPPPGTPLVKIPFIDVVSTSTTDSPQIKGDLWVLPFLNVYGVLGKVQGRADLLVNLDLDSVTPICRPNPVPFLPPICVGESLGGQRQLFFPTNVDATTFTLGATGVYSVDNWFFSGTLNGTLTVSGKDKTDVKSWGGSVRVGRRWIVGNNNVVSPFIGMSYTDIDTRIQGTASLRDALPSGSDLNARYDVQLDNRDKLAAVVGLNIGLNNGLSFLAEYNWGKGNDSNRTVFALETRF